MLSCLSRCVLRLAVSGPPASSLRLVSDPPRLQSAFNRTQGGLCAQRNCRGVFSLACPVEVPKNLSISVDKTGLLKVKFQMSGLTLLINRCQFGP